MLEGVENQCGKTYILAWERGGEGNGEGRETEPVTPKMHFLSLLFAVKKLHFRSCSAPFPHFGSGSMCCF